MTIIPQPFAHQQAVWTLISLLATVLGAVAVGVTWVADRIVAAFLDKREPEIDGQGVR